MAAEQGQTTRLRRTVNLIGAGPEKQKQTVCVSYRFSSVHQPQWASPAPRQSPQLLHWSHWATLTLSICTLPDTHKIHARTHTYFKHTQKDISGENNRELVLQ